jgi:hypothetical protein
MFAYSYQEIDIEKVVKENGLRGQVVPAAGAERLVVLLAKALASLGTSNGGDLR